MSEPVKNAMLTVSAVSKTFSTRKGPVVAADNVSFAVAEGSMFGILGPSGGGKSTLLRIIAGLENADIGEVTVGRTLVYSAARGIDVPPNRRDIALVFQSYAIWPHLSVFENVAFPLRVRGVRRRELVAEVESALDGVALGELADRPATTLSGGQQQRLALARAFVARPKLLLLDEPLSNLDARLRERMRAELRRLQREHGITTVFVTHDQAEGLSLADAVAVMESGRLLQLGTPQEIYEKPADLAVAGFIGSINLVRARATGRKAADGHPIFASEWGDLAVRCSDPPPAGEVLLGVRPEKLHLANGSAAALNCLAGAVEAVMYYGDHQEILLSVANARVAAVAPVRTAFATGQKLLFSVDAADITLLPNAGNGQRAEAEEERR